MKILIKDKTGENWVWHRIQPLVGLHGIRIGAIVIESVAEIEAITTHVGKDWMENHVRKNFVKLEKKENPDG